MDISMCLFRGYRDLNLFNQYLGWMYEDFNVFLLGCDSGEFNVPLLGCGSGDFNVPLGCDSEYEQDY